MAPTIKDLRAQAAKALADAKAIQAKMSEALDAPDFDAGNPPAEYAENGKKVAGLLGQFDVLKLQIEGLERTEAGDKFLDEPLPAKAALGWRPAAPGEGELEVDPKAWRETEVDGPFGKQKIRFNVPIVVQKKEYGPAFEGYLRKGKDGIGPQDLKTLTEAIDTAGGFTVPEDFHTELVKKIATMATIRSLARVVTTSRDSAKWPRVKYTTDNKYTSGVRLTWTGESPSSATVARVTDPVFGQIVIPVATAMASMPVSNDLIEDSAFDVLGIGSDLIAEAFALGENDTFINGTGSGQPMGFLTQVDGTPTGDVPTSTVSGTTSSLTADGMIDLYYAMPAQYRRNARFIMNSGSMKVTEKLKDSQNRYIVSSLINGSLATPQFDTIKGKPIVVDEFMPDVAANAYPVAFVDFSGYIIVDRVGFSIQRLDQLYAETNLTVLLARKRVGGFLAEPYRCQIQKCST